MATKLVAALSTISVRSTDSQSIKHRLLMGADQGSLANQDMSGWTCELFADDVLLKTITEASDGATLGKIENQTTSAGQYRFTLLPSDLAGIAAVAAKSTGQTASVSCYVRYTSAQTDPPLIFSVPFTLDVKKS